MSDCADSDLIEHSAQYGSFFSEIEAELANLPNFPVQFAQIA